MKKTKNGEYFLVSAKEMEELLKAKEAMGSSIEALTSPAKKEIVSDLINRKAGSTDEVYEKLKTLKFPVFRYTTCIVIEFEHSKKVNLGDITQKMDEVFPGSVFSGYKNDFLAFVPAKESAEVPVFDRDDMDSFLKKHSAYMAIAQPISNLLSLPTMYQDCKRSIKFGRIYSPNKNYFFAKNFFFEKIVDLCMNPANDDYHNKNVAYICDPGVITLQRYDNAHGTNLTNVLYNYLMAGQSIAECSRKMYIHRNTLINKLTKIEDILHQSLDDPYFMYKMFYSFQVLEYSDKVLGKKLVDMFAK